MQPSAFPNRTILDLQLNRKLIFSECAEYIKKASFFVAKIHIEQKCNDISTDLKENPLAFKKIVEIELKKLNPLVIIVVVRKHQWH